MVGSRGAGARVAARFTSESRSRQTAPTTSGGAFHGDLGEEFAARSQTGLNAYHDRPGMLELIGDVSGATVLDLGCGAGQYMAELVARGATVAGADGSESLLRHARARVGDETPLWLHDLEEPLVFAPAATPTSRSNRLVMSRAITGWAAPLVGGPPSCTWPLSRDANRCR